jgi:hypothetical protein
MSLNGELTRVQPIYIDFEHHNIMYIPAFHLCVILLLLHKYIHVSQLALRVLSHDMGSSLPVKPASASGQSTSNSSNSPQNRSWWATSWSLAALFVALGVTGAAVTWRHKPETHSLDYAVCSANRTIYTVDLDLPNVQCIVVHDTFISDTGDLGTHEST